MIPFTNRVGLVVRCYYGYEFILFVKIGVHPDQLALQKPADHYKHLFHPQDDFVSRDVEIAKFYTCPGTSK